MATRPGIGPETDDRRASSEGYSGPDRRVARSDRRIAPRMKTLKGAQIVPSDGGPILCIVRNISETGARLEVYNPVPFNTFELVFDDERWPRRQCRVVWRRPSGLGVSFGQEQSGLDRDARKRPAGRARAKPELAHS